jgi:hypothetical protein
MENEPPSPGPEVHPTARGPGRQDEERERPEAVSVGQLRTGIVVPLTAELPALMILA